MDRVTTYAHEQGCAQLFIQRGDETLVDEMYSSAPVDVAAVQKGLVALLIGMAQEQYLLEIVDHVNHHVEPEWTQLGPWDEAKLNIGHLMNMTTGMSDDLKPEGEIGVSWRYNNTAYQQLKRILCLHTGLSLNELSQQWMFEPLGMVESHWQEREQKLPDGTTATALFSTARDLAKVGQVMLDRGAPLLTDQYYMDQLGQPGSQENPAWGMMWWNNNQSYYKVLSSPKVRSGKPIPAAPDDLLAARGLGGNHLSISRSNQVIVSITRAPVKSSDKHMEESLWGLIREELGIAD